MINGSKISIHRFIATTLFRVVKEWPHSSGIFYSSLRSIYIYMLQVKFDFRLILISPNLV